MRLLIPAVLGAGLLYLTWRVVTVNSALVEVHFLFTTVELAVWEALLGAFLSGALLVGAYTLYRGLRAGLVGRRYRKRLADLEKEVHQLRNLPLSPEFDPQDRIPEPQALEPQALEPRALESQAPEPRALGSRAGAGAQGSEGVRGAKS